MQDNPSRLSSQRKGQEHTRERLRTTRTIPSPPLGSLSNTTRTSIAPRPPPTLSRANYRRSAHLLMEGKMKTKTCLSALVSLQDISLRQYHQSTRTILGFLARGFRTVRQAHFPSHHNGEKERCQKSSESRRKSC